MRFREKFRKIIWGWLPKYPHERMNLIHIMKNRFNFPIVIIVGIVILIFFGTVYARVGSVDMLSYALCHTFMFVCGIWCLVNFLKAIGELKEFLKMQGESNYKFAYILMIICVLLSIWIASLLWAPRLPNNPSLGIP